MVRGALIASLFWMFFFGGVPLRALRVPIEIAALAGEAGPPSDRMQASLDLLAKTASGRALLERAAKTWGIRTAELTSELKTYFRWGNVSRTHAVLTRRLDSRTGGEIRDREVTIFIRRDGTIEETVLDMAHELVHAVARPAWDPYDPSLTAGKYIQAAIDGDGGEVDAMVSECRVQKELELRVGPLSKRCRKYYSGTGSDVERASIQKDFYRVGKYYAQLVNSLDHEKERLTLLSDSPPELFSSTGQAPYPVALLDEYSELMKVACENSRRRIEVISSQSRRVPASFERQPVRDTTERFLRVRCQTKPVSS